MRAMDGQQHRFVMYRILGNDLPPRHESGQTYRNLQFVLNHEPEFADCDKRWILNRIVDGHEEQRLIRLLERHRQKYVRVPFNIDDYRASVTREICKNYSFEKDLRDEGTRQKYNKILYAMNNNGARNLALREGRGDAEWVLPLDGNCCFTRDGWDRLAAKIDSQSSLEACLVIPMFRLTDNDEFFDLTLEEREEHEPQVILGRDCKLEFNEAYRYGYRSKMELLLRLNVSYRLQHCMEILDEECKCGYVLRLFSGVPEAEGDWKKRGPIRNQGIDAMLHKLDEWAGLVEPRRAAA